MKTETPYQISLEHAKMTEMEAFDSSHNNAWMMTQEKEIKLHGIV